MASIDVTPQELRDIEIREAWRGYHRDDVDELLERAAATIEHLEEENQQLKTRLAQAPAAAKQPAPAQQPAPQPAQPAVVPVPAAMPPIRTSETDVIQRTLVLAQKAADEAVAEARAKAQQLLAESESKAKQMVDEAEATARRIADTERGKLEEEIARLAEKHRESLTADVDALERFEVEYRERLRNAIQAEMDLLATTKHGAADRPSLSAVDVPRPSASWSAAATSDWVASSEGYGATPDAATATVAPVSTSSAQIEGVQAYADDAVEGGAWAAEPAGGWDAPVVDEGVDVQPALAVDGDNEDTGQHAALDDDAFFASLREAVRDDSPLGTDEDSTDFFDQGPTDVDDERKLFRRRR